MTGNTSQRLLVLQVLESELRATITRSGEDYTEHAQTVNQLLQLQLKVQFPAASVLKTKTLPVVVSSEVGESALFVFSKPGE